MGSRKVVREGDGDMGKLPKRTSKPLGEFISRSAEEVKEPP